MSKETDLSDFVEDIADALRIRYSTNNLYNPQDFYSLILGLGGLEDTKEYVLKSVQDYLNHWSNANNV